MGGDRDNNDKNNKRGVQLILHILVYTFSSYLYWGLLVLHVQARYHGHDQEDPDHHYPDVRNTVKEGTGDGSCVTVALIERLIQ